MIWYHFVAHARPRQPDSPPKNLAPYGSQYQSARRVIVDSESDSDGEEDTQAVGAEAGASVQATLAAGRLVAGSGEGGGGGSAEGSASGEVGGLGGVRHRAAVAEARRRLGGGGKRGWVE